MLQSYGRMPEKPECIIEDDGKCYERVILCCSPMGGCRRNQSV